MTLLSASVFQNADLIPYMSVLNALQETFRSWHLPYDRSGWLNGWIDNSTLNKTIYFMKTDLYDLCGKISLFFFFISF